MKVLTICCLLVICTAAAFAQKETNVLKLDTIHLRGYIFDEFGKPVQNQGIGSSADKIRIKIDRYINNTNFTSNTDAKGFFNLCAFFNDTLTFVKSAVYNTSMPVYNTGSRYMIITLPHKKMVETNPDHAIQITALRTHKNKPTELQLGDADPYPQGDVPNLISVARYRKGNEKFIDFVTSNIVYPKKAIANNIEGEIKIGFIIESDGSIVRPWIIQGIGYGCDEEVMNAVLKSPKWVPSIENGRPATATQAIVVDFKLTDK